MPKLTSTFSGLDLEVSDLMLEIEAVIGFEIVYPDGADVQDGQDHALARAS